MTISLDNVGSGFKRSVINDNFDTIESEINTNVLTRDGGKALTADLDFNGNDLLNAANLSTSKLTLSGEEAESLSDLKGEQGDVGPTGPQGLQGTQGPQGVQGEAGVDGSSFTVDATGLAANRSSFDNEAEGFSYLATDLNELYIREGAVGNWSSPIVFGVGPQGPQGIQGIQGPTGPQGIQGPTGATGPEGPTPDISGKANISGTYSGLRAQATTKNDVGLGSVANYGVTTSVSSSSTTTYATASAVKTAYDEANKALSKVTLWTGNTTGDISLSQAYTNFRFLVIVAGETDWGSSLVIETGSIAKAWQRSSSKYVHSVGSDGFIEILQSGSSSTFLNMGGSLRGIVTAVYGVGDF